MQRIGTHILEDRLLWLLAGAALLAARGGGLRADLGEGGALRAALSASTRLMFGLEPLCAARTVIGGQEYDLTDAEADKAAAFVAGLIAARDLH